MPARRDAAACADRTGDYRSGTSHRLHLQEVHFVRSRAQAHPDSRHPHRQRRACGAQVTPAQTVTPPDDTPSIRIGAVIFTDYTVQTEPNITDVDGNSVNLSPVQRRSCVHQRHRQHLPPSSPSGSRPTSRERRHGSPLGFGSYTSTGSSTPTSQFNLDDWMTRGSWARLGMQQTPWVDFEEGIYRYRFQGTVFSERDGFLSSSDVGASFHYNFSSELRRCTRRLLQRRKLQPVGDEQREGVRDPRHAAAAPRALVCCAACGSPASITTTPT